MDPQKVDDIISKLPKENGWLSDDNSPLYNYQGFWYHKFRLRGAIAAHSLSGSLGQSPTDILFSCNPKCGTTWLKALSFAITTRTRFTLEENPIRCTNPHDLILYLEDLDFKTRNPDLPLLFTHLPYTNLPGSILSSGCKIVYIWRDPKDAFISRWHFSHRVQRANTEDGNKTELISLEEAFDLFCRGVSSYGPFWDHVIGYWKVLLDHPDEILFLKYEDMMEDVEVHVRRLAEFMGYPFSIEEEKEGVVAKIVEMCSFDSLRNLEVNKGGKFASNPITKDAFFRKAKVGDWKNYLTEEMASKIDQITKDKLGGSSGLYNFS